MKFVATREDNRDRAYFESPSYEEAEHHILTHLDQSYAWHLRMTNDEREENEE